ncbi:MAG: DUF91 domain-containing protein, partial [Candidatus Diapherotrites archaeon]|nr:DUF91 domain-containing protein [Candidatus Diapherotrites archaeon]
MIELSKARQTIERGLDNEEMLVLIGKCHAEYKGRASSKLKPGNRLILIKADKSIAIHQNKNLRPTNYMMNSTISCKTLPDGLEVTATKRNPKETLTIVF